MGDFLDEFKHLKIQLEAIKSATNSFDKGKVIGQGGFGMVYEGTISHSKGQSIVAIKHLDRSHGQGDPEFLKEILMLSRYTHQNLITLLGFCDEKGEKILVYEHASHGSLDRHLSDTTLTWRQRLKICLGAASGLCHLHDPKETQQRVIHRDIKSPNILLDENWNAKIADMGLSTIGPANQAQSFVATKVVGTHGYIDPVYVETYSLTKESDVYSFGVVLFEVLCGKLCWERKNDRFQNLVPTWKQSYEVKKLDEIILHELKQDMDPSSLVTFSDIAYRCLQKSRAERPKMSQVVEELEIALQFQEDSEDVEPPMDYEEISKSVVPPLLYASKEELKGLLSKGILVNGGNTWFSLNTNGEHCEFISAANSFTPTSNTSFDVVSRSSDKSRFAVNYRCSKFKMHVRTQFLSPHITYKISLVFSTDSKSQDYIGLNYILAGETKSWTSYLADEREDGCFIAELYHFTSDRRNVNLKITFDCETPLLIEGIKFQPLERVGNQVLKDEELDTQAISHWEEKLPTDYLEIVKLNLPGLCPIAKKEILKWSKDGLQWTAKKELYSIFCKGFLIDNGEKWFYLGKYGRKCQMVAASVALEADKWGWEFSPQSRFGRVAINCNESFQISCWCDMLSPKTTYGTYLVYILQEDHSRSEPPVKVNFVLDSFNEFFYSCYIYLHSPQTPIIRPKDCQNTHNPLNRHKKKRIPQQRNDGWMEVRIWEFRTRTDRASINCKLTPYDDNSLKGIIVQGIEFKPL